MLKVYLLLKRKEGMSMDEFIEHYETVHAPLGVASVPNLRHYERHYLRAGPYPLEQSVAEPEYDVITELWYDDLAAFDEKAALMAQRPEAVAAITADEANFLDRSKSRLVFVEDRASTIPAEGTGHGVG